MIIQYSPGDRNARETRAGEPSESESLGPVAAAPPDPRRRDSLNFSSSILSETPPDASSRPPSVRSTRPA